ncbi:hypothetical protein BH09PSE2_BH09PSE2_17890 [soil metagenome]
MTRRELEKLVAQQPRRSVTWVQDRYADSRRALDGGVHVSTPLWATFLAAAGAGAAFWWWTQWSRGKAEATATNTDTGGAGAQPAAPETIMAHTPAPAGDPINAVDKADEKLVEPAEELMAHAPVDTAPVGDGSSAKPKAAPKTKTAKAAAKPLSETLDKTLGGQGAPPAEKPAAKPASKGGPTIM